MERPTFAKLNGSIDERIHEATGLQNKEELLDKMKQRIGNRVNVSILAGGNCNQTCIDCFYAESELKQKEQTSHKEIDLPDKVNHVRQLVSNLDLKPGVYPREITCSMDLLPIYQSLHITRALTNAVNLTSDNIIQMKEYGIKSLAISLHGDRESHKFITGGDNYQKIVEGITRAINSGLQVRIFTTVYKGNVSSTDNLFSLASNIGVGGVDLIRLQPFGHAKDLPTDTFLEKGDVVNLIEIVEQARNKNPDLDIDFFSLSFGPNFHNKGIYKYLAGQTTSRPSPYPCPWIGQHFAGVSAQSGVVYPCFNAISNSDLAIGRISDDGCILNKPRITPQSLQGNLTGNCSKENCEYHDLCLGGCRLSAYSFAKRNEVTNPILAGTDLCITPIISEIIGR